MPEKGWDATGLLLPLWNRYEGGREALAAAVGTSPTTLSSINTGKRSLGRDLGPRLAAELEVTVFDLGAPEGEAVTRRERRVIDRLRELERALDELGPWLEEIGKRVTALEQPAQPRKRRGDGTR